MRALPGAGAATIGLPRLSAQAPGGKHPRKLPTEPCSVSLPAAEQSSSAGVLLSDALHLRDGGDPVPFVFGCETQVPQSKKSGFGFFKRAATSPAPSKHIWKRRAGTGRCCLSGCAPADA